MFIQVILPLKISWAPTYKADAHNVLRGQRVRVVFSRKEYIGVVRNVGVVPDVDPSRILDILGVEEKLPAISEQELRLWEFLADYYLCSIGEVYKTAYPAMKLKSEKIAAAAVQRKENAHLKMLEAMQARVERLRIRLKAKEAAIASKKEGTKGRLELEAGRDRILAELHAAQAALEGLMEPETGVSSNPLPSARPAAGKPLMILGNLADRAVEYSSRIRETLASGGQVLILTPDKAFCSMLGGSLDSGLELETFNADCTAARRRALAETLRSGIPTAVLGTKQAIFLPFSNLHLVIIDQEQEQSYKQTDHAPRYNGRDAAMALTSIHSAQVILGSASASFESQLNAISGKYQLQEIPQPQPVQAEIIDIPAERRKNGMVGVISRKLIEAVAACSGTVVFIRGWEKHEETVQQCSSIFGEGRIRVMSLPELKRDAPRDIELLAFLQADAFFGKDDFRSDERALQMLAMLRIFCPNIIIQTAVAERFSAARSTEELLRERKDFGLPPYSRTVEVLIEDKDPQRLQRMLRLLASAVPGAIPMEDRVRWNFKRDARLSANKKAVFNKVEDLEATFKYQGHFTIDVDPQ